MDRRVYDSSDEVQKALRNAAYRVACQYGELVRKAQVEDEKFVRSISFPPKDFIFTC